MAIAKDVAAQVDRIDERTQRITLNLPTIGAAAVEGIREDVSYDSDGNVVGQKVLFPPTSRTLEAVAEEEVEVDGKSVTLPFIIAALEAFFDFWSQEDQHSAAQQAQDEADRATEEEEAKTRRPSILAGKPAPLRAPGGPGTPVK